MRSRWLSAVLLLGLLPASAAASSFWGFGPAGQSSARVTWQSDSGQPVNALLFTLPVKARSAKTLRGEKCTIPRKHPHQVRCAISPPAVRGYVDVRTKTHLPCDKPLQFSVRPVGAKAFVRQQPIRSANGCG